MVFTFNLIQDNKVNRAFQPSGKQSLRNSKSSNVQKKTTSKSVSRRRIPSNSIDSTHPVNEPPRPLPDFFDSELSDEGEFWGFPPEAVVDNIQERFKFKFELNTKGKELFGEESSEECDFEGFTLEDL